MSQSSAHEPEPTRSVADAKGPGPRTGALQLLGVYMVFFGVLTGLVFPVLLQWMQVATARDAGSLRARAACLAAGLLVAGLNYALARIVVGRRLRLLTRQMHRVDELLRVATSTGEWSAIRDAPAHVPVKPSDEFGQAALTFEALVGALNDNILARRRLEATLHHQAFHDPLTGLANRALVIEQLTHALIRARRDTTTAAVLYVDLDGFKAINDAFGHAAGDEALMEVTRRLCVGRRAQDTVGRLGGDEFVVLMEDVEPKVAARAAHDVCAALHDPIGVGTHVVTLGASIGVAHSDESLASADALLRAADRAMYRAKTDGKNCYRLHPAHALPNLA